MLETQSQTLNKFDDQFAEFLGNVVMNSAYTYPALFDYESELPAMRWNREPVASKRSLQPELPTPAPCSQRAKDITGLGYSKQRFHTRDHLPVRFSKGTVDSIPANSDTTRKQVDEGEIGEDPPD